MQVLLDEIEELRDLSQRAGAMDYSKERVQTGEEIKEPAFLKALDKIDERIENYRKTIAEYDAYRADALEKLNRLDDGINIKILYLKFFKFESLEQIAREKEMRALTFEAIHKRYIRAMDEFDRRRLWED